MKLDKKDAVVCYMNAESNISNAQLTSQFDDVYPENTGFIFDVSREDIASEFETRGFLKDARIFTDCHTEFFVLYCPDM